MRWDTEGQPHVVNVSTGHQMKEQEVRITYKRVSLIGFDGKTHNEPLHLLVARTYRGDPPTKAHVADHINGDPHDNRLINIRWATRGANTRNRRVVKGWQKIRNKYYARISLRGKIVHGKARITPEEAHLDYLKLLDDNLPGVCTLATRDMIRRARGLDDPMFN